MSDLTVIAGRWLEWATAASWQIAVLVCLIAAITYLLRDSSPQLRYGLWMLVLLKALLPPTLTVAWGVGTWGVAPVTELGRRSGVVAVDSSGQIGAPGLVAEMGVSAETPHARASILTPSILLSLWAAGCMSLWVVVVWRYRRLVQTMPAMREVDGGPVRIELERMADRLEIPTAPQLFVTEQAQSPMLVGVLRPKVVLPENVLNRLGTEELRMILAHELVHWRRRDTWVGWVPGIRPRCVLVSSAGMARQCAHPT